MGITCRGVGIAFGVWFVVSVGILVYLPTDEFAVLIARESGMRGHLQTRERGYGDGGAIPRIIHQTWKNTQLPPHWANVSKSWQTIDGVEHRLWTDADNRQLIAKNHAWFLPIFDNYKFPIQRVDAARLFILHDFGGMYVDLDLERTGTMPDELWSAHAVLVQTTPVGVTNAIMMFEPKHPFLADVIQHLRDTATRSYIVSPYLSIMMSTGPTWLSYRLHLWTATETYSDIRLISRDWFRTFVTPVQGSSWHGWDAALAKFVVATARMVAAAGVPAAHFCLFFLAPIGAVYSMRRAVISWRSRKDFKAAVAAAAASSREMVFSPSPVLESDNRLAKLV